MGSSIEKGGKMAPEREMDDVEQKSFAKIQSILALTLYVAEHKLPIHAMSFVGRDDEGARKVRHDAGMEWALPHSGSERPLAELFREFWKSHRAEIESADFSSESACLALIDKMRDAGKKVPDTQT